MATGVPGQGAEVRERGEGSAQAWAAQTHGGPGAPALVSLCNDPCAAQHQPSPLRVLIPVLQKREERFREVK